PFYWAHKEPAIQWFHTIPFGMNPEGMAAWLYHGDGLKLMEETYAAFNLVPPKRGSGSTNGWMVPEEDHHDWRLQEPEDAHWPVGGKGLCKSGRHGSSHPGRRYLCCSRTGRD